MRTLLLFDDVDASVAVTSTHVNFEKRAEWTLQVTSSSLDGTPDIVVEVSIDNSETVFSPLENPETGLNTFPLDTSPVTIIDDRIFGKFFRIRLVPNANTTGTVKADLGYKTYP